MINLDTVSHNIGMAFYKYESGIYISGFITCMFLIKWGLSG